MMSINRKLIEAFPDQRITTIGDLSVFMGGSHHSFIGQLLCLMEKADPGNLARLTGAFPEEYVILSQWKEFRNPPTYRELLNAITSIILIDTEGIVTVDASHLHIETDHGTHIVPADILNLTQLVRELTTAKGWRSETTDHPHTFPAYVALAHRELSEALEAYRDKNWSGNDPASRKPTGVGPELADTLIRLIDMADRWKIDLRHEIERVLNYGWERAYQHGGRVL